LRTRVNLGSDIEVEANVEDTSTILIKTGLGFWAECSVSEAPSFIAANVRDLERRIRELDQRIASIRTHVKLTLQVLGELNSWTVGR
jgi:prefoldin subunit 5